MVVRAEGWFRVQSLGFRVWDGGEVKDLRMRVIMVENHSI